jgi:hypothetical protein
LAYQTRDLDPQFGEAKQLGKWQSLVEYETASFSKHGRFLKISLACIRISAGFSMYNVAFTGIVIVTMISIIDLDQVTQIVLQSVGVLWGSFFCSFAFVLPRLLKVKNERRSSTARRQSTSAAAMNPIHDVASSSEQITLPVAAMPESSIPYTNNEKNASKGLVRQQSKKLSFPFSTWDTIVNGTGQSEKTSEVGSVEGNHNDRGNHEVDIQMETRSCLHVVEESKISSSPDEL